MNNFIKSWVRVSQDEDTATAAAAEEEDEHKSLPLFAANWSEQSRRMQQAEWIENDGKIRIKYRSVWLLVCGETRVFRKFCSS